MKSLRTALRLRALAANSIGQLIAALLLFCISTVTARSIEAAGPATSGSVQPIAPPASVVLGALQSNSFVQFFNERPAFLLTQNVSVDITQPGIVGTQLNLTPGVVAANQLIESYLLHADPVSSGPVTFEGSITFDKPILGLLVQASTLTPSDSVLGSPTTIYTPTVDRGFEWPSTTAVGDLVQLSADFRTISFVLKTTTQYDQIRVITAGVPEPSSLALAFSCIACAFTVRRRRNR